MESNESQLILSDRVAVVTGANKGIGLEICRQLALRGAAVVLTARDETRGASAAESLRRGGAVVFHQLDVRDPLSAAALARFLADKFGRVDILVNNAGASGVSVDVEGLKALHLDPESWLSGKVAGIVQGVIKQGYSDAVECLDTNYYGCRRVTEALIPLLKLSMSGARIVNVSSLRSELKRIPNERIRDEVRDVDNLDEERIEKVLNRVLGGSEGREAGIWWLAGDATGIQHLEGGAQCLHEGASEEAPVHVHQLRPPWLREDRHKREHRGHHHRRGGQRSRDAGDDAQWRAFWLLLPSDQHCKLRRLKIPSLGKNPTFKLSLSSS